MDCGLDQSIDEDRWVKENPVYCPVPWCNAHKMRRFRCGDAEGDFVGIHVARMAYVGRFTAIEKRRAKDFREGGVTNPELSAGMVRMLQDWVDVGLLPGRKGRRKV